MITWIASFPRSGNTFFEIIFKSAFEVDTYYTLYKHEKKPLIPETVEKLRESAEMHFIKTHEHPTVEMRHDRLIYLIRDGRETMTSYLKYLNDFTGIHASLREVITGNYGYGSWAEHVEKWNPLHRPETFLVRFEKLIDKPEQVLAEIATFIGMEKKEIEIPTFDALHQRNPKFFRKGKKDSWKEVFSELDHNYFWFLSYDIMRAYGYLDDMPAIYANDTIQSDFSYLQKEYLSNVYRMFSAYRKDELTKREKTIQAGKNEIKRKQEVIERLSNKIAEVHKEKRELADQCKLLERELRQKDKVLNQMDGMFRISVVKHPLAKFKLYKQLAHLYYGRKGGA